MPKKVDLTLFEDPLDVIVSSEVIVPNQQPRIKNVPYKIAIIGEAPGADEVEQGRPFVGYSGKELDRFLSRFGILRDACYVGNVCRHRPPSNKIAAFDWDGPQIQGGITKLIEELKEFDPYIILCLGGSALHLFKSPNFREPLKKRKGKEGYVFNYPNSISDWRGSFFTTPILGTQTKCIAAYHPAACLRQYEWTPLLMMDISRCVAESKTRELVLPNRTLLVNLSFEQTCQELDKLVESKATIGTDIEGYWNNIRCVGFASSPDYAFIVPFTTMGGQSLWTLEEETVLWRKVTNVLSHPQITKVWQNGLYDRFCFQYGYSLVVRGPSHDIMLKTWELYCELEKSLGVQASLYTKEPYYKGEIKSDDRETFWRYCCKDAALTLEIDQKLERFLSDESRRHYQFNLTLLNSLLYMEIRGIKYNKSLAKSRLREIEQQIYELQHDLNKIAGIGLSSTDKIILRNQLRDVCCYKRDASQVKKEHSDDFNICMRILNGEADLSKSDLGRLEVVLGCSLNIKGAALKTYLYETLKLPKQIDPLTKATTCDYEALLVLSKKSSHPSLPLIITIGELRTRSQMLRIETDSDGRVRAGYNIVGSETGRVTCYTSPTGSGYNMQTIPDDNELKSEGHPLRQGMRDLIVADEGCYLYKCDLKGSDGWTVGANLAALGDTTMLEDLKAGLKPAAILCYIIRHGTSSLAGKTRQEISLLCKEVKKSDFDYFSAKQCIWGYCYLMGVRKAAQHTFNVSEGTVVVEESETQKQKDAVIRRYNIPLWWRATEQRLFNQPYPPKFASPSGHVRMFFGRRSDIVGQALAHEPQSITTYANNLAIYRLWTDPENRRPGQFPPLRVEPLHQVHDEGDFQGKADDSQWARAKIHSWYENEIVIAGKKITIPFDGQYGTSWAMDSKTKTGDI